MADDPNPNDDPPPITADNPEVKKLIEAAVAEQVKGLKDTNKSLKDEKTQLSESLKAWEGLDSEEVQKVMSLFANDEEAKLLKEGKIDEVIAKRTERMAKDHVKALEGRDGKIGELEGQVKSRDGQLSRLVIDGAVRDAGIKAEIISSATDDILLRARGVFSVGEDGKPVALDADGTKILSKDGKTPLSPGEWLEGMRETAGHWWAPPTGGNAPGSGGALGTGQMTYEQAGALPQAEYEKARKEGKIA